MIDESELIKEIIQAFNEVKDSEYKKNPHNHFTMRYTEYMALEKEEDKDVFVAIGEIRLFTPADPEGEPITHIRSAIEGEAVTPLELMMLRIKVINYLMFAGLIKIADMFIDKQNSFRTNALDYFYNQQDKELKQNTDSGDAKEEYDGNEDTV